MVTNQLYSQRVSYFVTFLFVLLTLSGCSGRRSTNDRQADVETTDSSVIEETQQLVNIPIVGDIYIEIAHQSGVAGFPFSIFGGAFGQPQGAGFVTINNVNATITNWQDGVIEGIVPQTADGETTLTVTNKNGDQASEKFVVYSINPQFLQPATQTYRDIVHGKAIFKTELDKSFCYEQPGDSFLEQAEFLTNFRCGYAGYTRVGDAYFSADADRGREGIIAVDTEQLLQGDYFFQFFSDSNWYSYRKGRSYPKDYMIEVSADSTDGRNGSWEIVHQQRDNLRATRLHAVTIPNAGYRWVRMRVTDGNGDGDDEVEGRDFSIREIRFYEASGSNNARPNTYAIYGDSITADAFNLIGPMGFSQRLKTANGDNNDVVFAALGLAGQNASGFEDSESSDAEIHDAFALDNMGQQIRYWGLGIGTNDSASGSDQFDVDYSNIAQFHDRLAQLIPNMIAQGNVPLIARIPDTSSEWGFSGDFLAKKKVLADIDAIAARYQLIPGPDMYTPFRKNITYQESSFIREGDGVHHTELGHVEFVSNWANAFARIPYSGEVISQAAIPEQLLVVPEQLPTIPEQLPTTSAQQSSARVEQPTCDNKGLTMAIWDNVVGPTIAILTNNPAYPNSPTRVQALDAFETTILGDNYGARINGYLTVPVTGRYTFWISGDDETELWLSSDATRENLFKIAQTPEWTLPYEWDKFGEQESPELVLQAGQRYYIEALMKENIGRDHLSVAWQVTGSERVLIDGNYLCAS